MALASTFGPTIANTVLPTAKKNTKIIPSLYLAIYFISLPIDFLKFLGFSVTTPGGPCLRAAISFVPLSACKSKLLFVFFL